MRSNASLIVFFLASLLISDVFCTNILKKSSNVRMVQMLEKLEFSTYFGKTLISTVQLKLKTGNIDEVYSLLDELTTSIQEQQSEADSEYQSNNAGWNNQIAELTENIDGLNADLQTQNGNLAEFQEEQLDHQATYDTLVATGVELDNNLEALNDYWVSFSDAYNARQAERQKVLDALDTIISQLTERYNAGSFIQLKDLVSNLKAVKAQKNPILSLVELTLSFNPATVKNVIDRLTSVRESVSTGASQDSEYYEYSKTLYQVQQSSLTQQIQDNTDAQNTEVVTLSGLRSSISDTEDQIDADNSALENNRNLLDSITAAQTVYNAKYDSDTTVRSGEIGVIQHVQEILSSNDSNLRPNTDED